MYKLILRIGGLLILLGFNVAIDAAEEPKHVLGRLLAAYHEGTDPNLLQRTWLLHGVVPRRTLSKLRVTVLDVREESSEAVLKSLIRTGLFEYVEHDYYARTAAVPNDPSYIAQWHLPRIGSAEAWNVTTGSPSVVVAVIDSGVYGQHPDLGHKVVPGWNFVDGNADTTDVLGHGTAVAGTLGADSNNGIGVAGVSWASLVMPLVVVDPNDYAAYSNIAAAILYAARSGRPGDQHQHRRPESLVHLAERSGLCVEQGSRHLQLGHE